MAKFRSNEDLGSCLPGTRTPVLVEARPRDRIWGIGIGKNNPAAPNIPRGWRGPKPPRIRAHASSSRTTEAHMTSIQYMDPDPEDRLHEFAFANSPAVPGCPREPFYRSLLEGDASQSGRPQDYRQCLQRRQRLGPRFRCAGSAMGPQPDAAYRDWYRSCDGNDFELGAMQIVAVVGDLIVANLTGQHDIRPTPDGPPVPYWAIEAGLFDLSDESLTLEASIPMRRIGCGLAVGEWETVESWECVGGNLLACS